MSSVVLITAVDGTESIAGPFQYDETAEDYAIFWKDMWPEMEFKAVKCTPWRHVQSELFDRKKEELKREQQDRSRLATPESPEGS